MRKVLLGALLGAVVVLLAQFLFFTQGGMPVATRGGPLPMEELLAGRALHVAVGKEADRPSPLPADEPNLLAGVKVYGAHCVVCHGPPHEAQRTAIAAGMFPRPPQLMPPSKGVTDDPVGETFWKVKNGIRLTGMPAFEGALSDTEMWQVSLLLLQANQLPAGVLRALE